MTTIDLSFSQLTCLTDIYDEQPRQGATRHTIIETKEDGTNVLAKKPRHDATTLKLNNNAIPDLTNIVAVLVIPCLLPALSSLHDHYSLQTKALWAPNSLTMLDLSFNAISTIEPSLSELPSLAILYLHGNSIANIKQVQRLSKMSTLRSLSLHGNPVEMVDGYRNYTIAVVPSLKKLDFTTVTPSERERSETWCASLAPKQLSTKRKKQAA
eukprot:TRINITY_DN9855_c0_g1_i3.p1 TRINITY_DN9855_c0_g1~~TRINITY_DN9855_c0_g1_i3.p1  ORF type:complete len:212 (+),score=29.13 TRINITY_DN9855_c0_g1_i3:74-709(+)